MISASIGVVAMAALFVVFGLFRLADGRRSCGGGDCGSCSQECSLDAEGRHP